MQLCFCDQEEIDDYKTSLRASVFKIDLVVLLQEWEYIDCAISTPALR